MRRELPFRSLHRLGWTDTLMLAVGLLLCAAFLLLWRIVAAEFEGARLSRLEAGLTAHGEVSIVLRHPWPAVDARQAEAPAAILSVNLETLRAVVEQEERLQAPFDALLTAVAQWAVMPPRSESDAQDPRGQGGSTMAALQGMDNALRAEVQEQRRASHRNWRLGVGTALLSSLTGLVLLALQRRKLLRGAQRQVAVATAQLRAVYTAAPIGLVLLDEHLRIQRANPSFAAMAHLERGLPAGSPLEQAVPELAEVLAPLLQDALRRGDALQGREVTIIPILGALPRHYFVAAEPVLGVEEPALMSLVVVDVTDRVAAEAWREEVVAELNHRVKNMLATVQSLAAQTLRGAGHDPHRFAADFSARLGALSRSHELIAADGWNGTTVIQAAHAALAPWLPSGRLTLVGPSRLTLRAAQVQALMVGLTELAGNASRYGALSGGGGRVTLSWELVAGGLVRLSWHEAGGPRLAGPPARRGFGLRFLERGVAHDLGREARAKLTFDPGGLSYEVIFRPHSHGHPTGELRKAAGAAA